MPDTQIQEQHRHYEIVALIIGYLREHAHRQPSLKELASANFIYSYFSPQQRCAADKIR